MIGQQATIEEIATEAVEKFAVGNLYTGPAASTGVTFMGWPLDILIDAALPRAPVHLKGAVLMELHKKYPVHGAGVAPAAAAYSPFEMLSMRMRWVRTPDCFAHIDIHRVNDIVFVWVIMLDGSNVVIEDDNNLFPSDALITKISMLAK